LLERLCERAPQNEPALEYVGDNDDDDDEVDIEFLIDDENLPEFYNPYEVLRLEKWLQKAAIASIVASAVSNLVALPQMQGVVLSYFMDNHIEWNFVAWLIAIVIFVVMVGLQSVILFYLPLKALGSILRILMEMEFHSRGILKTQE